MDEERFLISEIKHIRKSVETIGKDVVELKIEMAKIKTEVQLKSSIIGACFGLIGPIIYYLKKSILP